MSAVDLSIIVPIFNEEESVVPLWQQTAAAVEKLGKTFEIIFIDDGSTDKSQSVLAAPQFWPDGGDVGEVRSRARRDHHPDGRGPAKRPG
jgi:glycosyltransferase involved in cell wall biosynthesis